MESVPLRVQDPEGTQTCFSTQTRHMFSPESSPESSQPSYVFGVCPSELPDLPSALWSCSCAKVNTLHILAHTSAGPMQLHPGSDGTPEKKEAALLQWGLKFCSSSIWKTLPDSYRKLGGQTSPASDNSYETFMWPYVIRPLTP